MIQYVEYNALRRNSDFSVVQESINNLDRDFPLVPLPSPLPPEPEAPTSRINEIIEQLRREEIIEPRLQRQLLGEIRHFKTNGDQWERKGAQIALDKMQSREDTTHISMQEIKRLRPFWKRFFG